MTAISRSIVANRLNPFATLYDPDSETAGEAESERTNPVTRYQDDGRLISVPLSVCCQQYSAYRLRRIERSPNCVYCGKKLSHGSTLDHVVAVNRNGGNWPGNLFLACLNCNNNKGDLTLAEWASKLRDTICPIQNLLDRVTELQADAFEAFIPCERRKKPTAPRKLGLGIS